MTGIVRVDGKSARSGIVQTLLVVYHVIATKGLSANVSIQHAHIASKNIWEEGDGVTRASLLFTIKTKYTLQL